MRVPSSMRNLLVLLVVSTALAHVPPAGAGAQTISPSSEGPLLAFTALSALKPRGFSVGAIGADGLGRLVLARGSQKGVVPNPFSSVSWSTNGAWLVFAGSKGKRKGIYGLRADATGLKFIRGTKGGRNPVFSPDGSKIAFARDRLDGLSFGGTTTWVVNAHGRDGVRMTPWRKNIEYLPSSFSLDGSALAVTKRDLTSGDSTALLFRLDRSRGVRVLARRASEAAFSPDGSHIALVRHVLSRRGKALNVINKDLYVMSVDGAESKPVTYTDGVAETHPSWDPSGQRIAFQSFHISKDPIEALFDQLLPVGNSIVQVNADGSCRQKLLSLENAALFGPVWRSGPLAKQVQLSVEG